MAGTVSMEIESTGYFYALTWHQEFASTQSSD